MNPGGVRSDLTYADSSGEGDGVVTYGEAFTFQPFGNSLKTFPMTGHYKFVMLEKMTSTTANPAQSVVLDFANAPGLSAQFDSMPGGAQVIGKLAGTRTILDYDNDQIVYSVPHLMVEEIAAPGTGRE